MPVSNGAFALVNIHLCESIFYQHKHMHLMGLNLSFPYLTHYFMLGLKCFDKVCFVIFTVKRVFALLLRQVPFHFGHTD